MGELGGVGSRGHSRRLRWVATLTAALLAAAPATMHAQALQADSLETAIVGPAARTLRATWAAADHGQPVPTRYCVLDPVFVARRGVLIIAELVPVPDGETCVPRVAIVVVHRDGNRGLTADELADAMSHARPFVLVQFSIDQAATLTADSASVRRPPVRPSSASGATL